MISSAGTRQNRRFAANRRSNAVMAIVMASDPCRSWLREQAGGPDQQEAERDDIGEPALDAAPDDRAKISFRELFRSTDDQAADYRTRDRIEAAKHAHG